MPPPRLWPCEAEGVGGAGTGDGLRRAARPRCRLSLSGLHGPQRRRPGRSPPPPPRSGPPAPRPPRGRGGGGAAGPGAHSAPSPPVRGRLEGPDPPPAHATRHNLAYWAEEVTAYLAPLPGGRGARYA